MSFSKAHLLPYNQLAALKFHIPTPPSNYHVCPNLATNIHRNNTSDFNKVSTKLYLMEMDTEANNYQFLCFVCFLRLKLHPSFQLTTINDKSCTLSHNLHTTEKYIL